MSRNHSGATGTLNTTIVVCGACCITPSSHKTTPGHSFISQNPDSTITQSWTTNADAWTRAVRSGTIDSRERVTNAAVVETVMACQPRRLLDLGCGEGWLVRVLLANGIQAVGIDGSQPLIDAAIARGGGEFQLCTYEELVHRPEQIEGTFDVIVANFALLQEHLGPLLRSLGGLLSAHGQLVIQTVHPAGVDHPEQEGWRQEDFRSFDGQWQPMPWYYRTRDSWKDLLQASGFRLNNVREPVHPDNGKPLSLVFIATPST